MSLYRNHNRRCDGAPVFPEKSAFGFMLKGAIGGSLAMVALFGAAIPLFGIEPTPVGEGLAATLGAIAGVVAARKRRARA